MKYQQLENLECGWKMELLGKKMERRRGLDHLPYWFKWSWCRRASCLKLRTPTYRRSWGSGPTCRQSLITSLNKRSEPSVNVTSTPNKHTKKKSIDHLDYRVWEKLSPTSKRARLYVIWRDRVFGWGEASRSGAGQQNSNQSQRRFGNSLFRRQIQ